MELSGTAIASLREAARRSVRPKCQTRFEVEGPRAIQSFTLHSIKIYYIWVNEIDNYSDGTELIEKAFNDYNNIRLYSTINYEPPAVFEKKCFNGSSFREEYKICPDKLKEKRYRRYRKNKDVKEVSLKWVKKCPDFCGTDKITLTKPGRTIINKSSIYFINSSILFKSNNNT